MKNLNRFLALGLLAGLAVTSSCKKDEETAPKMDYAKIADSASYVATFKNSAGDTTVDRTEGRYRLAMFRGLASYASSGTTKTLDANVLKSMFAGSGFTDTYAYLNSTGLSIKSATASSLSSSDANAVSSFIEKSFDEIADASKTFADSAKQGKAGVLYKGTSKYLVDEKGIEWAQIIQKSLIGGYQLDYIGNILLSSGLDADNKSLVAGKKYTQLEHNWDIAYGFLTNNDIYSYGATDSKKGVAELYLGSYVWEYNKEGYKKLHGAFVKGRAAIVNNDKTVLKEQADLIRKEFEKAIASAAIGYLGKWKTGATDGERAHAIGEGAGFIYSLRFCKMNGADSNFSENVLNNLLFSSENGFYDLTTDKIEAASTAIKTKFGL